MLNKKGKDELKIFSEGIDIKTQREYVDFSKNINTDNFSVREIIERGWKILKADKLTDFEIKTNLILLANLGGYEAHKILDQYAAIAPERLQNWAKIALNECWILFSVSNSEGDKSFISTGLGGKKNRMRCYFVLYSKSGSFDEDQKKIIKKILRSDASFFASIIEEIDFEKNYVLVGILVPLDVAMGEVTGKIIKDCNKMHDFISPDYYVTNVKKPTRGEIMKIKKEIDDKI